LFLKPLAFALPRLIRRHLAVEIALPRLQFLHAVQQLLFGLHRIEVQLLCPFEFRLEDLGLLRGGQFGQLPVDRIQTAFPGGPGRQGGRRLPSGALDLQFLHHFEFL